MLAKDLSVSNVHITEDEYNYKGTFKISGNGKSMDSELVDLEAPAKIEEIKKLFGLDEANDEVRKAIFDKVMEKASISSHISEGEGYQEKNAGTDLEKKMKSLDAI